MNPKKLSLLILALLTFCSSTSAYGWRVRTVETHYIEREPSFEEALMYLIAIPLIFLLADNYAKNYVEQQEDIEDYIVTVKIKDRSKTILEQVFSSSEYDEVIDNVLDFARREMKDNYTFVIRPSIKIFNRRHPYALGTIRKPRLPFKPEKVRGYWERLDRELTRTFTIPDQHTSGRRAEAPRSHIHYVEHHHVTVVPQPVVVAQS